MINTNINILIYKILLNRICIIFNFIYISNYICLNILYYKNSQSTLIYKYITMSLAKELCSTVVPSSFW